VGIAGFSAGATSNQSLAMDDSTPYVAYKDGGNGYKTTVMKFDGSNWVNVGSPGFSAGVAYRQSLAMDGSTPYVAYQDKANGDKTTVMKFDGSSWVNVGIAGFSAGQADYQSLAMDGSIPYVAYQDGSNGYKTTVMKFDGSNWVNVGTPGFSSGSASFLSLAMDGSTPYIAYRDAANLNKTTVMKFDGSNWVNVGSSGFSAGPARNQSLAMDGSTPYVAYRDQNNSWKTSVMKFDGTNWVYVGNAAFSSELADHQSLAMDGSTPYVATRDGANGQKTTVMKFDGSNWVNVGSAGFTTGPDRNQSLAMDGSIPYVAFRDGNLGKATVMKFDLPCPITNSFGAIWIRSDYKAAGASDPQTYYWGLSNGTITARPKNGIGPYTYQWSSSEGYTIINDTQKQARLLSPTGPQWVTVKITDVGSGCSIEDSVYINWVDFTCNQPSVWFYELCNTITNTTSCVQGTLNMRNLINTGDYVFGPCGVPKRGEDFSNSGGSELIFKTFPNPSDGNYSYTVSGITEGEFTTELYDLNGRILFTESFSSSSESITRQVDVEGVAPGSYFMRVTVNNNESVVQKVMIVR
jgi:hypothetical protein